MTTPVLIKNGDVVKLKSGGPAMTVRNYYRDTLWVCQWFVAKELKEGFFTQDQLEQTQPD